MGSKHSKNTVVPVLPLDDTFEKRYPMHEEKKLQEEKRRQIELIVIDRSGVKDPDPKFIEFISRDMDKLSFEDIHTRYDKFITSRIKHIMYDIYQIVQKLIEVEDKYNLFMNVIDNTTETIKNCNTLINEYKNDKQMSDGERTVKIARKRVDIQNIVRDDHVVQDVIDNIKKLQGLVKKYNRLAQNTHHQKFVGLQVDTIDILDYVPKDMHRHTGSDYR